METFTTLAVKEFIFLYNGYSNHPFLLYGLQNNNAWWRAEEVVPCMPTKNF